MIWVGRELKDHPGLKGLRGGLAFISGWFCAEKEVGLKAEGSESMGRLRGEVKTTAFGWLWLLTPHGRAGLGLLSGLQWWANWAVEMQWESLKPWVKRCGRVGGSGAVESKPPSPAGLWWDRKRTMTTHWYLGEKLPPALCHCSWSRWSAAAFILDLKNCFESWSEAEAESSWRQNWGGNRILPFLGAA